MTPSIADLIDELSALLEKSTPGPWRGVPADDYVIEADGYPHKYGGRFQEDDTGFYLAIFGNRPKDFGEANRDIAVAAVNALPTLLDALKSLQAERDEAVTRLAEVRESLAYRGSLLGRETARADAAQETIGRLREALEQIKLLTPENGIRYIPMAPTENQRDVARASDLYQIGDIRFVCVNEGDLIHTSLVSDIARKALETEGAER